ETELPVPDDRHRRLNRRVQHVEGDDRGKDELGKGKGHDEAHYAVHFAAEVGVEADAHDDHPQDGPAYAAHELAAVPERPLELPQPDGVDSAQHPHAASASPARHPVCSPPRRPKDSRWSLGPAASSRISRPVSDKKTLSRLTDSTDRARTRVPWAAR